MINTRIEQHGNGSWEIVKVLDDESLGRWSPRQPLAFEKSIVWLQPIESLDFVRVAVLHKAKSRRGPLLFDGSGVVVGYSKLTTDAPHDPVTRAFTRRLFYLRDDDSQLNMNQFPAGAVDPKTVLPGVFGDPPRVEDVERGYPWYMCRSQLGLPLPAVASTAPAS